MILGKITVKLLFVVTFLDITHHLVLPKLSLLLWVFILMILDLITGLLKAKFLKDPITSERMRGTIIKFLQYFGCIGVVIVIINQEHESENVKAAMNWLKNGVTMLILYIECYSVLENLYQMDKKSTFARFVVRPLYRLLSLAIKDNELNRQAKVAEQEKNGERDPNDRKKVTE